MNFEIDEIEEIECLGEICDDVYDVGMVDTPHTFFANDILVHNSVYLGVGRILDSFNYKQDDIRKTEKFIDEKISPIIVKVINTAMEKVSLKRMNVPENKIFFKREMIARRGIHIAKKRYVAYVLNMEGVPVEEGSDHEIEVKGIEIVRSSTPEIVRNYLTEVVKTILKTVNETEVRNVLSKQYLEFMNKPIEEIAQNTSCNKFNEYISDGELKTGVSIPRSVKLAWGYHYLLDKFGISDIYEHVFNGDKIKTIYTKTHPTYPFDGVAFKGKYPKEFDLTINYDIMWFKVMIKPLQQLYQILNWPLPSCDQEDISDLIS